MFRQGPSIWDYYHQIIEKIRLHIADTPDREALSYEAADWERKIVEDAMLQPIERDPTREPDMREVRDHVIHYRYPVLPNRTLSRYVGKLESSRILMTHSINEIKFDERQNFLHFEAPQAWFQQTLSFFNETVAAWSEDIRTQNQNFPWQVRQYIEQRIAKAKDSRKDFDDFAQRTGVKLRQKESISNVVPVAVQVRTEVKPIIKKVITEARLTLDAETLKAILFLIDNQGRQFERTPTVFSRLVEEDLRDILLNSLNAVFEDRALGEAFQGVGKTDIHLRIAKGELFLAECKQWKGRATATEATKQLLDRLTWHESHGVVLLVNYDREDFGNVRQTVKDAIPTMPGAAGAVRAIAEHHFGCSFALPSDTTKRVEIRFLVYNLFVPRPSKRSRPRK